MSVLCAFGSWPSRTGPPPVSKKIKLMLLKLEAKLESRIGVNGICKSGTVRNRKRCQGVAPSTSAASKSSSGIVVSAPSVAVMKYGKLSQRLTSSTAALAQSGSSSQGAGGTPNSPSRRLIAPKLVLNSVCHI